MPLSPSQILNNRYRIVKLLGQGGFGAVYRVWDIHLETPRALKENLELSPEAQRQFKREAQILDKLSHPNLPKVIDHFEIPGQGQYLVMEFVEGEDLRQLQQAGQPLPESQVVAWVLQICDALVYLHSQTPPIIHRDIKPANIKVNSSGKAMLVDFGIAKVFDPNLNTTVGAKAVTPGYSPIEQYGRGGYTDARTDIYAVGATLYRLLTGYDPVDAPERNVGIENPAPRSLNASISPHVEQVIQKAMALIPADRYKDVNQLRQALVNKSNDVVSLVSDIQEINAVSLNADSIPVYGKARATPSGKQAFPWKLVIALGALVSVLALVVALQWGQSSQRSVTFPTFTAAALSIDLPTEIPLPISPTAAPAVQLPTSTPKPTATNTQSAITPTSTITAAPGGMVTGILDDAGIPMSFVPAGDFQMGSLEGRDNERPVHIVNLAGFYIDQYEVTNTQYARCAEAKKCQPPRSMRSDTRQSYYGNPDYSNFPVIWVTWDMAQAYCKWRGARLPTEAEWEKAARGGLVGMLYPWGNSRPVCSEKSQYGVNMNKCVGDTAAVGSYSPNGYGLFDMVGNVWEWTSDWFSETYYEIAPIENPLGPASGNGRVLRGGGAFDGEMTVRVAFRNRYHPQDGVYDVGFRCAKNP